MKKVLIFLLVASIIGCKSEKPNKEEYIDQLEAEDTSIPALSEENISQIINSIPSPVEISFFIHDAGISYDKSVLNDENNVSKYNSNYKKSINLGVYGADLGYTDIYEQSQDGINYLTSVRDLAEDLGIGQYFDFETIKTLTENGNNIDSLLLVTIDNFNGIKDHFQEQGRSELSALLLIGGWVESLHLTCQANAQRGGINELKERIGEQKIILENLLIILDVYSSKDASIASLRSSMMRLKDAYETVSINYNYEESSSTIVDGVLVIENNSTTTVDISDESVEEITNITTEIRNEIIS